jgi:hypothetical protein
MRAKEGDAYAAHSQCQKTIRPQAAGSYKVTGRGMRLECSAYFRSLLSGSDRIWCFV